MQRRSRPARPRSRLGCIARCEGTSPGWTDARGPAASAGFTGRQDRAGAAERHPHPRARSEV